MSYERLLDYLRRRTNYERVRVPRDADRALQPERMRALARALGDPQDALAVVHIAGSKGKGTTAAMVEAIARAAGARTGLFTSPHLIDLRERVRIDFAPIAADALAAAGDEVIAAADALAAHGQEPTFFEILTALAFVAFARARVDLAVLEVGLGGRLDSTNVVARPLASAITVIDLEHTAVLGDTLAAVAAEKAGIVKPGAPVATLETAAEPLAAIEAAVAAAGTRLLRLGRDFALADVRVGRGGTDFAVRTGERTRAGLRSPMIGRQHAEDAALAIQLWELVAPRIGAAGSGDPVARGLAQARWPGRFDLLPGEPPVVVDCAHTGGSARRLAHTVAEVFGERGAVLVLGVADDKDLDAIARGLAPCARAAVATITEGPRGQRPERVAEALRAAGLPPGQVQVEPAIDAALARARERALDEAVPVVVTGSVYLAGDVLGRLAPERAGVLR